MFKRAYEPIEPYLLPNKVLVVYGPRRVGKTTLLQNFLKHADDAVITPSNVQGCIFS